MPMTMTDESPAFDLNWRANGPNTLFVAVSRNFEPPAHCDLLATVGGTPNGSAGRLIPGNPAFACSRFYHARPSGGVCGNAGSQLARS